MATAIRGTAKPSRRKVGQAHLSHAYRKAGGEMAVVMKRFFYHEKGNHDEAWYYLARVTRAARSISSMNGQSGEIWAPSV